MQFTTAYRQTTKNRRRCMICQKLIKDGELAFFKGPKGRQGKAVHEDCRADTGGGWYARDCAVTYQPQRRGNWVEVTDYDLKAKEEERAKEEANARMIDEMREDVAQGRMAEDVFERITERYEKSEHGYLFIKKEKTLSSGPKVARHPNGYLFIKKERKS